MDDDVALSSCMFVIMLRLVRLAAKLNAIHFINQCSNLVEHQESSWPNAIFSGLLLIIPDLQAHWWSKVSCCYIEAQLQNRKHKACTCHKSWSSWSTLVFQQLGSFLLGLATIAQGIAYRDRWDEFQVESKFIWDEKAHQNNQTLLQRGVLRFKNWGMILTPETKAVIYQVNLQRQSGRIAKRLICGYQHRHQCTAWLLP